MNTFKTQFQFIAASFIFWISACVVDPVDPNGNITGPSEITIAVSYTHLRAHETVLDLVCRLLLEKTKQQ